jgi:hypothetical protein
VAVRPKTEDAHVQATRIHDRRVVPARLRGGVRRVAGQAQDPSRLHAQRPRHVAEQPAVQRSTIVVRDTHVLVELDQPHRGQVEPAVPGQPRHPGVDAER